jgi:two-component sensor histidine kinase
MTSSVHASETRATVVAPLLLVEEINHRVANEYAIAIASIGLEAARIVDAEARAALRRVAAKLGAFAEAHRALESPSSNGEMSLGDHLDRLCAAISDAALRDRGVKLILLEDEILLAPERCWRVGLIVAELITNAVRHGFGGAGGMIVIEVRRHGAEVSCQVADNGGSLPNPPASRGRQVVEALAGELGGEVSWRFGPDGVTANLNFPLGPELSARPSIPSE